MAACSIGSIEHHAVMR